jgi:hypothetical protein
VIQQAVERPAASKQTGRKKRRPVRSSEQRHTEEETFSVPVTDDTFKRAPQFYRAGTPNTDKF